MSTKINDGGPAFPHDDRAQYYERSGMTLRDYFAAKAMEIAHEHHNGAHEKGFEGLAKFAYHYADAMLKARQS